MSPQLTVLTNESSGSGTGIPTGTGTVFVAGATDAGPPPSGPLYVKCRSLSDFINAFGPRSSTSALLYDFLDEFFHDGGQVAYVTRVTDNTATSAALTLDDGQSAPKPTVVVTALTAGAEGNDTFVTVTAGTGSTFTATTTNSSATLSSISSFKSIGVGTPVTGTGIPANTYISAVNTSAATATMSQSATAGASGVTITPGTATLTILVQDASGDQIADETHGPYYTTAQLFADTTSQWVSFTQSAGSGFTQNLPAALASTALTGGADPSDLTDTSHVNALANFGASLGPGTVCLPGKTSTTAWTGLLAHGASKNRFAVLDMADNTSAASVASAAAALTPGANGSYGMLVQGSLILAPTVGTGVATRTCPGSAAVAALCAQVAATSNQAQAPCGQKWPLSYPLGFTTFNGPIPATSSTGGCFSESDIQTLENAAVPVNVFSNFYGRLCLFGFVTTLSSSIELIYDQATASRERMALVSDAQQAMAPYLFDDINLATIEQMQTDLNAVCLNHYSGGALYDQGTGQASNAFEVNTAAPINTPQTAQAKQLNAEIETHIVRYADTVNTTITVIPVTVALPAAA